MKLSQVDVSKNRSAKKWNHKEQAGRILWVIVWPFFRFSPRPLWWWRNWMLRRFGAVVGRNVHIYPSVRITMPWNLTLGDECAVGDSVILYALGPIRIDHKATVSQNVHLCAGSHDWHSPEMTLLKQPIKIGAEAWICADAFVGPGVTIGVRAIVGARAVAMSDVVADVIIVGNPGRVLKRRASEVS